MKIHEYQAKELFRKVGIPVPDGQVCHKREEIPSLVATLNLPVAIKAQILAGGRGKGGGVALAKTAEEAQAVAERILGMRLVTLQTGDQGTEVRTILFEQAIVLKKELYLSMLIDRERADIVIIASRDGGMDIEKVAQKTPERIISVHVNPLLGLQGYQLRELIFGLDLDSAAAKSFADLVRKLFDLFLDSDCSLVEINPLAITAEDTVIALDAKIDIDANSLFRHPEIKAMHDSSEDDVLEAAAAAHGLNYIRLDGTIGSMVNGAGLAMATMDLIKQAGVEPANFLDVGGGASAEMVENGFRIILSDPNVRGIFINIFGGILRCDILAQGVVAAARKVGLSLPVVVRMEGTNVEEGREILARSGLDLTNATDLNHAASLLTAMVY
ncbi:MAG: ADP-forming succinate--CoA ligase subunit beta [Proteobacteria bacterium]|nr:ADP-forming succinate--CoA ligase subunit beta [Pseudomonadota bacterium]MBU1453521.1 ADP-forming succinate--CoA ligase subunit beta [Pseudomonadota bacterium]